MKRFTPEQIVAKLRQADRELGKGLTVKEVCRKIEVDRAAMAEAGRAGAKCRWFCETHMRGRGSYIQRGRGDRGRDF